MAAPTGTAKKARLLLLKVDVAGTSPTVYTTVAGGRSKTVTINNELVDITDDQSAPYRKLLEDAGLRSISLSFSGVFKDEDAIRKIEQDGAHSGLALDCQIVMPNGDEILGSFIVSSFEFAGEFNGEQTYALTLENADVWIFNRAP